MKAHMGFPGGTSVNNLPANVGDVRDAGSIPGSGRPLEEEMATTHRSSPAWKIPWTEEAGRLQSMRVTKSQTRLK